MRYKTTKQRATAAARIFKRNKSLDTRNFSGLFEEGDGDEVKALLIQRAHADPTLWDAMDRHGYVKHWSMERDPKHAHLAAVSALIALRDKLAALDASMGTVNVPNGDTALGTGAYRALTTISVCLEEVHEELTGEFVA